MLSVYHFHLELHLLFQIYSHFLTVWSLQMLSRMISKTLWESFACIQKSHLKKALETQPWKVWENLGNLPLVLNLWLGYLVCLTFLLLILVSLDSWKTQYFVELARASAEKGKMQDALPFSNPSRSQTFELLIS